jgi:hypothetical protein
MHQHNYDVAIAYRVYPKVSTSSPPPPVFGDDKFKLVEFCFQSFVNSLGGIRAKLWVLLNGCPPCYEAIFSERWAAQDLTILNYPSVGAGVTLSEQFRILREQADAPIVHFAEDDYYYLPGQYKVAVDFLRETPDADFATIYESSDFYTADLHDMRYEKRPFGGKEWMSCISTTHTFLAKRSVLMECQGMFEHLSKCYKGRTIPDLAMWMALTKKRVFNPYKFLLWSLSHRWFWAGSMVMSWYFCWRQIVFGRRYSLWQAHPCTGTHMVSGLESPGVDWRSMFNKQLAETVPIE